MNQPITYTAKEISPEEKEKILERMKKESEIDTLTSVKKSFDTEHYFKIWRKFWYDRWIFENRMSRIIEFKEGMKQYRLYGYGLPTFDQILGLK